MPVGAARDLPMVMRENWDGDAAKGRIFAWAGFDGDSPDPGKARKGFLWYDGDAEPTARGSYKLPFADVVDGKLTAVAAGCRAAASRLPQTEGMSSEDREKARSVLDHYMGMMRGERASEMLHVQVSEFRGTYPDIPLPEDIDKEALNGAFFVTLPIMPPNAKSGNGRKYSAKFPETVAREINVNRPEGRWGHLRPDERPTRYEPPAVRWLAAAMDGNGMAWGKLIPLTPEAKEHFRVAKATNARVATSIYGWVTEQNGEAVDIELESIDLADPSRAGIKETVAKPVITSEMQGEEEQ